MKDHMCKLYLHFSTNTATITVQYMYTSTGTIMYIKFSLYTVQKSSLAALRWRNKHFRIVNSLNDVRIAKRGEQVSKDCVHALTHNRNPLIRIGYLHVVQFSMYKRIQANSQDLQQLWFIKIIEYFIHWDTTFICHKHFIAS